MHTLSAWFHDLLAMRRSPFRPPGPTTDVRCGQGHAMSHHGHGQVWSHQPLCGFVHQQEIGLSDEQVATRSVALEAEPPPIVLGCTGGQARFRAMMWDAKAICRPSRPM